MTILKVFESLFTEIRFENSITTPTKKLNTTRAEVMEGDQLLIENGDEQVYASLRMDAHPSLFYYFRANPILGGIGKKEGETRLTNIVM